MKAIKYKGNIYQEKSHGYHFSYRKSMANKQQHGEYFQLLIELVAKLHEPSKE